MIMFCLEKSNGFCDSLSFLCGCGEELGLDVFGSYICWSQVYRVGGFSVFHQFFLQKCWLRYGGVSEPELSFVRGDVSCVFQLSVWVLLSWHAVSGNACFLAKFLHGICLSFCVSNQGCR
jgi:hypothetical protein